MQFDAISFQSLREVWNAQPPPLWTFEEIKNSATIRKTALQASAICSKLAMVAVAGAFAAYKFLTAPIWLPATLFAGITVLAILALSYTFKYVATRFQAWKQDAPLEELYAKQILHVLKQNIPADQVIKAFNDINAVFDGEVAKFYPSHQVYVLGICTKLTPEHELDIILAANARHVLVKLPPKITSIQEGVEPEQKFILAYLRSTVITFINGHNIPGQIMNQQIQQMFGDVRNHGVVLSDDKKSITFDADKFPEKDLLQFCEARSKYWKVKILISPQKAQKAQEFERLKTDNNSNIELIYTSSEEEAAKALDELRSFCTGHSG